MERNESEKSFQSIRKENEAVMTDLADNDDERNRESESDGLRG